MKNNSFKRTLASVMALGALTTAYSYADDISLEQPGYGGNGCPQGSVNATLSPDRKTVSILFDAFTLKAGGLNGRSLDRKSCNISIPVHVPQGMSVSVLKVDYRGFNVLPAGASSQFNAEYFFAGQQGPTYSKVFNGSVNSDFFVSNEVESTAVVWSECGANLNFRTNMNMNVQTTGNQEAIAGIDSADIQAGIQYQLQWKTCGGYMPPQPPVNPNPYPTYTPTPDPYNPPYNPNPYPTYTPTPDPYNPPYNPNPYPTYTPPYTPPPVVRGSDLIGNYVSNSSGNRISIMQGYSSNAEFLAQYNYNQPGLLQRSGQGFTFYSGGSFLIQQIGDGCISLARATYDGGFVNTGERLCKTNSQYPDPSQGSGSSQAALNGVIYSFSLDYNSALIATNTRTGQRSNLGGRLTSQPIAVSMDYDINVFARGTDGAVFYRSFNRGWTSLGGNVRQILSVTRLSSYYSSSDVMIRAIGTDGRTYSRTLNSGWVLSY